MSSRTLLIRIGIFLTALLIVVGIYLLLKYPLNGTLVCTTPDIKGEITTHISYNVKFKMRKIKKIQISKTLKSDDVEVLNMYHVIMEEEKKELEELKNYKTTLTKKNGVIIYNIDIDYTNEETNDTKISHLKESYERIGSTCKYK